MGFIVRNSFGLCLLPELCGLPNMRLSGRAMNKMFYSFG
jgi:hypothetical protein